MGNFLDQCCNDAWEVIRGRKKIIGNKILDIDDNYVEEIENSDYGWLEPNGKFHFVEFGKHQAWAGQFIKNLYRNGKITVEELMQSSKEYDIGDWLVKRGWILLHDPMNGNARITKDPAKRYTKAQINYLYSYLCERGRIEEANKLYSEEI